MSLFENISLAIHGLVANKMRSLLTMLGIIIGIGSVIAITSVGNAMTNEVNETMTSFGVTNISVMLSPKDKQSYAEYEDDDMFTDEDIEKMKTKFSDQIRGIGLSKNAGGGEITHKHKDYKVNVSGVNEDYEIIDDINISKGRFISEKDRIRSKKVAVISEKLASSLFSAVQNPLGSQIKVDLNDKLETFTVIGVFEEPETSALIQRNDTQTTFYIPVTTAKELADEKDGYGSFMVNAKPGTNCTALALDIQNYFNQGIYAANNRFEVYSESLESMISQAQTMMGTISLAIAVIAGISLLVGGIGVMNIMLVSVTERTREIGVRKALGAKNSAIRAQFIVESMIICLIGGVFGILFGAGLGSIGGMLLKQPVSPTLSSITVAVGFSMAIGIFFGFYPANKAAKLDPIEALRYE
jgi:putative ABC transport system permease protein